MLQGEIQKLRRLAFFSCALCEVDYELDLGTIKSPQRENARERGFEHSVLPTCSEERRQLEPELAFWSKFASAKAAHVLFLAPL